MGRGGDRGLRPAVLVAGALALATLASGLLVAPANAAPEPATVPGDDPGAPNLSATLDVLSDPSVAEATPVEQAAAADVPATGFRSLRRATGGEILVDVRVAAYGTSAEAALASVGATVRVGDASLRTYTVAIDPADLAALSALPGVEWAQEVLTPTTSSEATATVAERAGRAAAASRLAPAACGTGTVDEGDAQLGAATARSTYGVDGTGVVVGVISDSFDRKGGYATDVSTGDLPGTGNPCGRTTPITVDHEGPSTAKDEGRAMAQIIHDLAPGATMRFATGFDGQVAMATYIRELAAEGATVIVDDVGYSDEAVFQDGPVGKAIADVTAQGVAYFSAAGNLNRYLNGKASNSYQAQYRPTACPAAYAATLGWASCHDFDPGPGVDNTYGLTVSNFGVVSVDLDWSQPAYGVTTNMELALVYDGAVRKVSRYFPSQGTPANTLSTGSINLSDPNVSILVGNANGGPDPLFRTESFGLESAREYETSQGGDVIGPMAVGHGNATKAISVAAVPYNDSSKVEDFSSRGPATYCWGPVDGTTPAAALPSCLTKHLDVAATDGNANTFFGSISNGFHRFFGTSAAAPHAAAIAALQRQAEPCRSPEQIAAAQRASGKLVGSYGQDAMGSGLVWAPDAIANLTTCATVPDPPTNVRATPTVDGVRLDYTRPANTGGKPITSWRIRAYEQDGSLRTPLGEYFSPGASNVLFDQWYVTGHLYRYCISAQNVVGFSECSELSNLAGMGVAPTADAQSVDAPRGTATPITLTGADPSGLDVTFVVDDQPTKGTLSCGGATGADCTYEPDAGATGSDSFTFHTNNGLQDSDPATVSITIPSLAPSATPQAVDAPRAIATPITLAGTDPADLPLTFAIDDQPAKGDVTCSGPSGASCTYTSDPGATGTDSFTFHADNGSEPSSPATVSITITNTAPDARNVVVTANAPRTPTTVNLDASDPNGDSLALAVDGQPTKGTVSCLGALCVYNARIGTTGTDSFTYKATDGDGASDTATVSITLDSTTPGIFIGDGDKVEPESGTANARGLTLPVLLSQPSPVPLTIRYATTAGTAQSGVDFIRFGTVSQPQTLVIPAGTTWSAVAIPVLDDNVVEGDETFTVTVLSVTGGPAYLGDSTGTATIHDADSVARAAGVPILSMSTVAQREGNAPTIRKGQVRIELSKALAAPLKVTYRTVAGSAAAGSDFVAKTGTITFAAGSLEQSIDAQLLANVLAQGSRSFQIEITSITGGSVSTRNLTTTFTIRDDD